jgi:signal peptidase
MGKREYEALIIIGVIILSLVIGEMVLMPLLGSTVYQFILKPAFWLLLSYYILKKPRVRFKGKLKLFRFIMLWSAICGIVYVSVYFAGGFIDGIGTSPYARSIKGMLMNILGFGSVLVMMEWVRNYIINKVKKEYTIIFSVIVVTVFTLYKLNLRMLSAVETWPQMVQYLGEYAIPEMMNNILLTYLVYIGGAFPAALYSAVTNIPIWLSPVLPGLTWISKAFIGIMAPVIFLIVLRRVYKKESREVKLREQKAEKPAVWIASSLISIMIIWFAAGVFPVFPTVILTGSMKPAIDPGDVVIVRKAEAGDVKIGDIIQYWRGDIFIIHRVIDIKETGEFQTKGDNNISPDSSLVEPGQLMGKVIAVVPKVGHISLWFRGYNLISDEALEF